MEQSPSKFSKSLPNSPQHPLKNPAPKKLILTNFASLPSQRSSASSTPLPSPGPTPIKSYASAVSGQVSQSPSLQPPVNQSLPRPTQNITRKLSMEIPEDSPLGREVINNRRLGVYFEALEDVHIKLYSAALREIVPADSITHVIRKGNTIIAFFSAQEYAQTAINIGITLGAFQIFGKPLTQSSVLLTLNPVAPELPDAALVALLSKCGRVLGAVKTLSVAPVDPLDKNIRGQRRQVRVLFATEEARERCPQELSYKLGATIYRVYVTVGTHCYNCKEVGHIRSNCPHPQGGSRPPVDPVPLQVAELNSQPAIPGLLPEPAAAPTQPVPHQSPPPSARSTGQPLPPVESEVSAPLDTPMVIADVPAKPDLPCAGAGHKFTEPPNITRDTAVTLNIPESSSVIHSDVSPTSSIDLQPSRKFLRTSSPSVTQPPLEPRYLRSKDPPKSTSTLIENITKFPANVTKITVTEYFKKTDPIPGPLQPHQLATILLNPSNQPISSMDCIKSHILNLSAVIAQLSFMKDRLPKGSEFNQYRKSLRGKIDTLKDKASKQIQPC